MKSFLKMLGAAALVALSCLPAQANGPLLGARRTIIVEERIAPPVVLQSPLLLSDPCSNVGLSYGGVNVGVGGFRGVREVGGFRGVRGVRGFHRGGVAVVIH
jgi:hypothetical protein